jgi:hypothetical protein
MSQHTNEDQRRAVQAMLSGLTPDEIAAAGIEALRRWWRGRHDRLDTFQLHGDFGRNFVLVVGERKQAPFDAQSLKEPFLYDQHEPWMADVVEFLWWLERAGFAVPLQPVNSETDGYPSQLRVTKAGARLLEGEGDALLLPGAIERVRSRCPGLPNEVLVHLVDARSCLDHALARPAVVLLGLAYETAIDQAIEALIARSSISPETTRQKAAKSISAVKRMLDPRPDSEEKFTAIAAWDFADVLRRRRNDGSHTRPAYGFDDLSEFHELFVSALRHLPGLWGVAAVH